jgi:hypothetical protein
MSLDKRGKIPTAVGEPGIVVAVVAASKVKVYGSAGQVEGGFVFWF